MIDELLGRATLKARIEELEEENHHLGRHADAEEERRSDAVADKQRAEERVNQLTDRIESLEDRIERAESDETHVDYRRVGDLHGDQLVDVLGRLRSIKSDDPEGLLTAVVPDGDGVPDSVSTQLGDRSLLARRAAPAVVLTDDSGAISVALAPPITPEPFDTWGDAFTLADEWFRPTGRLAFALVRSDTFAVGRYENGERIDIEGFTSDVKEAHSKGGFSQGRFERRRENQIDDHLEKAADTLATITDDVDRTIVVGERSVLGSVRKYADYTDVSDATGSPTAALSNAFHDFWTTRVYAI